MTLLLIYIGVLAAIMLVSMIARARYLRDVADDRAVRKQLGVPAPKSSTAAESGGGAQLFPFDSPSGDGGGGD